MTNYYTIKDASADSEYIDDFGARMHQLAIAAEFAYGEDSDLVQAYERILRALIELGEAQQALRDTQSWILYRESF